MGAFLPAAVLQWYTCSLYVAEISRQDVAQDHLLEAWQDIRAL